MDSPVRPEFLKAFAAGSLEIHCSMIFLRQNTADGGHEFKGPGAITVARDRDGFTLSPCGAGSTTCIGRLTRRVSPSPTFCAQIATSARRGLFSAGRSLRTLQSGRAPSI